MRTWKDGINDPPPPRMVCGICGLELEEIDHSICRQIATNRGHFGSIAVNPHSAPIERER